MHPIAIMTDPTTTTLGIADKIGAASINVNPVNVSFNPIYSPPTLIYLSHSN
jgi:hypothetical protein